MKPVGPQLDQLKTVNVKTLKGRNSERPTDPHLGLVPVPVRRKRSLPRPGLLVRDLLARCRQNDWQDGVSVGDQQTRSRTHSKKLDFIRTLSASRNRSSSRSLAFSFWGGGSSTTITDVGRSRLPVQTTHYLSTRVDHHSEERVKRPSRSTQHLTQKDATLQPGIEARLGYLKQSSGTYLPLRDTFAVGAIRITRHQVSICCSG